VSENLLEIVLEKVLVNLWADMLDFQLVFLLVGVLEDTFVDICILINLIHLSLNMDRTGNHCIACIFSI